MPTASSTSAAVTVNGGSMRTTRSAVRFTIRPALRTPSDDRERVDRQFESAHHAGAANALHDGVLLP